MILVIILRDRSGSSCLKGRRRTRDWSGRRIVDVRCTRIEEEVIMDWLSGETSAEPVTIFNTSPLPNAPGTPRRGYYSFDRLQEPNWGNDYGLAQALWMSGLFLSSHLPSHHGRRPGRLLLLP